jgi:hypothetical protein
MPSKTSRPTRTNKKRPPWLNMLLMLSLVPMLGGFLIAAATAVGLVFMGSGEAQAMVGSIFMLGGFTLVNALQKKWLLALGWGLPGLGLWILTTASTDLHQAIGFGLMSAGILLLVYEIAKTLREQLPTPK